jgi:stearoyl-CoA desaturase (delta-9 desaturase)
MKWFTVRFFKRRTLSGDRTRYIFVDESQYGLVATNVAFFVIAHLFYLISLSITLKYTDGWIYAYCFGMFTSLGISPGVHRLWSHRCYSARLPLRIFLSICFTAVGQNDIYTWCRDHRLHHKFTETDADPHNSRRGAFFAHVGWLLTKKHPDVLIKGKTIDNSDLLKDPVVYWNRKLYILKYLLFRVYMPGLIPYYVFKVPLYLVAMGTYAQYVANLHATWFVNSAAHIFGDRPYNHKIQPRENFAVALFGYNEGFHNYHHQFPWDWRIAEHGIQWFDPGKWFIQLMYMVGLAYNLKEASPKLIQDTKERVRRETVKNLDAGFYVHDHPYFIPHQFTDDDVGSTINKEATEVSAEAAMTRPSTFSPSSSMTDINNNLIECQG